MTKFFFSKDAGCRLLANFYFSEDFSDFFYMLRELQKTHLGACQLSMMELFYENSKVLLADN